MKKKIYFLLIVLTLLFVVIGCEFKERVRVEESDNGGTVEINQDQRLELKFRIEPATGIAWDPTEYDENILKFVDDEDWEYGTQEHEDEFGYDEDQDIQILTFDAVKTGETVLKLKKHRRWEENSPALDEFSITVKTTVVEEIEE